MTPMIHSRIHLCFALFEHLSFLPCKNSDAQANRSIERGIRLILALVLITTSLVATISPAYAAPNHQPHVDPDWVLFGEKGGDRLGAALTGGDFNADGYSDLVVSAMGHPYSNNDGEVLVYYGGPDGLGTEPDWIETGARSHDRFGTAVANAGDMNGDGIDDLLIGAPGVAESGMLYLYLGGEEGLAQTPAWEVGDQNDFESLGVTVATGDVNGDGWIDVIAGATEYDRYTGAIYVYYNSAEGLSTEYNWWAQGSEYNDEYGQALAVGDVNADGYADIAVGGPGAKDGGFAVLYLGSEDGVVNDLAWAYISEEWSELFGQSLTMGDVDGDGYDDLLVGITGYDVMRGAVILYPGTDDGIESVPTWQVQGEARGDQLGQSVGFIPRLGEDGVIRQDIIMGAYTYPENDEIGRVYRFYSEAGLPESLPSWVVTGGEKEDFFGEILANIGDVNGDGAPDLAVSSPGHDEARGQIAVFYGTNVVTEPIVATEGATEGTTTSADYTVLSEQLVEIEETRLFSISPDGQWLLGEREEAWLCVYAVDLNGGSLEEANCVNWVETIDAPIHYASFAWSPDSRYVALTEEGQRFFYESDIWLYDVTEASLYNLTDDDLAGNVMTLDSETGATMIDWYPTWSPDGSQLAFARSSIAERMTTIELLTEGDIESTTYTMVSEEETLLIASPMQWLPNADGLFFTWLSADSGDPNWGIWLATADGDEPQKLLDADPELGIPTLRGVSAEGDMLLLHYPMAEFAGESWSPYALHDLTTGETTKLEPRSTLLQEYVRVTSAIISPDGTQLLYVAVAETDEFYEGYLTILRDLESGNEQILHVTDERVGIERVLGHGINWADNDTVFLSKMQIPEAGLLLELGEAAPAGASESTDVAELVAEGYTLARSFKFEEAIMLLTQALELDPNNAEVYAYRGLSHIGLSRWQPGVENLITAFDLDPTLGIDYLELFDRGIEDNPDSAAHYNDRGRALLALGEYSRAMIDFDRAVTLEPEIAIYYANRGLAYVQMNFREPAFADFAAAIELDPTYFRVYYDRGVAYLEEGEFVLALEDFNQALELNPDHVPALNNRAALAMMAEEYAVAVDDYTSAIALSPTDADLYENRGTAHYRLEEYEAAMADFDRSLELDPEQATVHRRRGLIYYNLDDLATALAEFDQALAIDDTLLDAYLSRGLTYYLLEEYENAATDLEFYLMWAGEVENRDQINDILYEAISQTEGSKIVSPTPVPNQTADQENEQPSGDSVTESWPQIIYAGGGKIAEITASGEVWIYGDKVGDIVDGDIWVEGDDEGDLTEDGEVWYAGDKIGDITSDGEVWYEGDKIGDIEADGTIWYEGNVIGSTEDGKHEYAAIILFYDFYNEFLQ